MLRHSNADNARAQYPFFKKVSCEYNAISHVIKCYLLSIMGKQHSFAWVLT